MRVVVTGGSGKAGQWVVRAVAGAGHEVVNIDLVRRDELPGEFCRVELTDAGAVYDALFQARPDAVCHLAANPSPSGQARVDVFANNVLSAYNLMQAASDAGARRVIYASSEMATGLLTEGATLDGIPGVLIHGRYDVSGPLEIAWRLSQRWSTSRLHVIDDAGHGDGDAFLTAIMDALAQFAAT